ncbi:MAG: redoxin domain-containing protein [Proteobacteria bacterium]|nr:redoxin domain-containing protein [Pseudomonadota bacterium]
MNKTTNLLIASLSCLVATPGSAQTQRVADFSLLDSNGEYHQLSRYSDRIAVLLYIHQDSCPLTDQGVAQLASFASNFKESIPLLVISPGAAMTGVERLSSRSIPVLLDATGYVAQALRVSYAGTLLLVDPVAFAATTLDAASDYLPPELNTAQARQLNAALGAIAESTDSAACALAVLPYQQRQQIPSYVTDVAPILEQRCAFCHREGGSAPWAMSEYRMIQGWAPMMREVLLTRRMPPSQVDADPAQFDGLNHITDDEMITLISWIDAGASAEELGQGAEDPLRAIEPYAGGWQLGTPDEIFTFAEQSVPATGVMDYIWLTLETGLTEDKWVEGYEFALGDPAVVHHARIFTQEKSYSGEQALMDFAAYAPGKSTIFYPDGIAQHFSSNDRLVMQIHYTTNGRATQDQTRLGLHYADEAPQQALTNPITVNEGIHIPAGARNYETSASLVLTDDSYLYAMSPHMHYRGKSMKYIAHYPDGTSEQLLSVPNYQFQWQMNYWYKEPKFLPAGTTIVTEGAFDNSTANPNNPNADVDVTWGEQSWDEMFIGWMAIAVDNP